MRILAVTNLYPNPFQPNRATFNRTRIRLLSLRFPVRVIAPIDWLDELKARIGGQPALARQRQVGLDGLTVDHPRYLFPRMTARRWYGHFYRSSIRSSFAAAVREFAPTLVFAPWAYPDAWAAVKLGHGVGLPVVIQCHGSDILALEQYPARAAPTREALCAAEGVVAVSQDIAGRIIDMGVDPARVRVIYDGIDTAKFHPGPRSEARCQLDVAAGDAMVLFVGNLLPVKAVDVLLAACSRVVREGRQLQLVVIGDGPLRRHLESMADQLGLGGRVRFLGSVPHDSLPRWFQAADLFVLPSRSEGVPTVLLEASACGLPWVASRVGGIPEIAHLGASRLVAPDRPEELAAAIVECLDAPAGEALRQSPRTAQQAVAELVDFLGLCASRSGVAHA
jgi:glycosyltransferase involved in cell wall biosynthesis